MLGGNDLAAKELASEIATELVPVGAEVDGTSGAETIDVTFPARVNEELSPKKHTDREHTWRLEGWERMPVGGVTIVKLRCGRDAVGWWVVSAWSAKTNIPRLRRIMRFGRILLRSR